MSTLDSKARILVVDDEVEIRRLLRVALSAQGYFVIEAKNGREGINKTALEHPDIMILDMGLPDIEGLDVIRSVREWSPIPIIILSVREREKDKIAALDSGASDYVVKPFNMGELMARVRVALRSLVPGSDKPVIEIGNLSMDLSRRITTISGKEIKYRIDIGVKDTGVPTERTLTLKGTWKVKRNIGLTFESAYKAGEVHSIVFGADAKLTSKDTVSLNSPVTRANLCRISCTSITAKADGSLHIFCRVLSHRLGP